MATQLDATEGPPGPDALMDLLFGSVTVPLVKLPILRAGLELEVWAKIAAGHRTAKEVAAIEGAGEGGVRRLLDALTVMKLLEKEGGNYTLPAWAEHYLIPGKPAYLGAFVLEWLAWEGHGQLADAIRKGKRPIGADYTREETVDHFVPFYAVRALAPQRYLERHYACWRALRIEPREGLRVLDAACGAGIAGLSLARLHPGVEVVLQDWPPMLELALEAARRLGVGQQVTTLPGDMSSVDYGEDKFDVARLGYVTYFYALDYLAKLFRRLHRALAPGGVLVIDAPLSDEGRREREEAVLDGPWLFAVSPGGDVYSFSDYERLLQDAGFVSITEVSQELVKAIRPS
jgi:SAM-dependent methyltransferase